MERTYEDTIRDQEVTLGVPPGPLGTLTRVRRPRAGPVRGAMVHLRLHETYAPSPTRSRIYIHPGIAGIHLNLCGHLRFSGSKPSDVFAASFSASLRPGAGLPALAGVVEGFAADLEARALLRARIRYRRDTEIRRRDADVADARRVVEAVRAIIPALRAGELRYEPMEKSSSDDADE